MARFGLAGCNRVALVGWTAGLAALAVRWPDAEMLASSVDPRTRTAAIGALWLAGTLTVLLWQRTLWTTMGSGAGFRAEGGVGLVGLSRLTTTTRDRTVTATAVRRGWWPFARLRVEAALATPDPDATLELSVTTDGDPEGRVLFEAPDADRRYVLRDGGGNLDDVFTTDFKADLVDVETPGTLTVADGHVRYDVSSLPFDAGRLSDCAGATVRLAEQVERASGERRSVQ